MILESRMTFDLNRNNDKYDEEERKAGLSKLAIATAKDELNETSLGKSQALAILKDWIKKHPQLINVRTDDNFLLRFLRVRKFNVPMTEHNLVKYLNFRQSIPEFSLNLDPTEKKVDELFSDGYLFVSPIRDSSGRRIVIYNAGKMDPKKYTKVEMAKAHLIAYETLMEDEETQVLGVTHFVDLKDMSMSQVALWSPLEMSICLRIGEQALPLRHKAVHVINYSAPFKFVIDFATNRVSEKMKNRLVLQDSIESLHEHVGAECLPKEYGGVIPMAEMIDLWKKEMAGSRSRLLNLDTMKSLVPIKRKTQVEELAGSFKKLEVD